MQKIKPLSCFRMGAIALACSSLFGCGDTDIDNAGIDTGTIETIEPILYQGGTSFKRYSREVTNSETGKTELEYYFENSGANFAGVNADYPTQIQSVGIYGMSEDANVPVNVVSVKDITGTLYDPKIKNLLSITEDDCLARNANTEFANIKAQQDWQAQVADAEANGRPAPEQPVDLVLETCDSDEYLYELAQITPVPMADAIDVTELGFFKYELKPTFDVDSQEFVGKSAAMTTGEGTLTLLTNITPTFDLDDTQWDKAYQAVIQVGNHQDEFIINTASRDPSVDKKENFLSSKRNLKPGRTFVMKPITFTGFNTNAPVVLSKNDVDENGEVIPSFTDFDILYAINETDLSLFKVYEPGVTQLTIRDGQKLNLAVQSKDGDDIASFYDQTLVVRTVVGEEGIEKSTATATVHTHAIDYLPGPTLKWNYPVASSATYQDKVTLRGKVTISQDQLDFANNGKVPDATIPTEHTVDKLTIYRIDANGNRVAEGQLDASQLTLLADESIMVDSATSDQQVKRNVYAWQFQVSLADGDNQFAVIAESNLARDWPADQNRDRQVAMTDESIAKITRIAAGEKLEYFPSFMTTSVLEHIADVSLDPRDNSLFLLDQSGNNDSITGNQAPGILWRYSLEGTEKPTCLTLPWSWQDAGVNGVQFNHALPEVGGVVIGGSPGNLAYYSDDDLNGDVTFSNKGNYQTNWEGVKHPGHFAYSADGTQLFMSAKSNFNQQPEYQAIIGLKTPRIEDNVFKGFGAGVGIIAKETDSTQDAAKMNNNAVSLDIYSTVTGSDDPEAMYEEYLLTLDGKDNLTLGNNGQTYLRKTKVSASYVPDQASTRITLYDDSGAEIKLYKSDAVAVSNQRGKAYIVDNKDKLIYEVDLTDIATSDVLTAKVIASPQHANQPTLGNIKALVIEGDMDYMLISDVKNDADYSALLVMDLETYDMGYVLRTNNIIVGDPDLTHCSQ
ncbi:hypothetical protein C2869_03375 [Saccharobesus litoralis]|uniref:Uncharacterized protein n=1 Tax=Saccharobesus litoralis TaxID=2172099 RepID=A0A2S0VMX6_9ALTE|nr:hypothetical protein [Saccharobesus litoralis]AWB65532.1 hypothetical protein C2869_03375 [Saccharobesus litoralis]